MSDFAVHFSVLLMCFCSQDSCWSVPLWANTKAVDSQLGWDWFPQAHPAEPHRPVHYLQSSSAANSQLTDWKWVGKSIETFFFYCNLVKYVWWLLLPQGGFIVTQIQVFCKLRVMGVLTMETSMDGPKLRFSKAILTGGVFCFSTRVIN